MAYVWCIKFIEMLSCFFHSTVLLFMCVYSVHGLNFDFVAYNLFGHFCYGVFNVGMFWSIAVQV